METDLIVISEYCRKCRVEPSFILLLEEEGLIRVNVVDGERYVLESQLQDLERYTRLHYDLSVNVEGIDVIRHLLERMQSMQDEIRYLKSHLCVYQSPDVREY